MKSSGNFLHSSHETISGNGLAWHKIDKKQKEGGYTVAEWHLYHSFRRSKLYRKHGASSDQGDY